MPFWFGMVEVATASMIHMLYVLLCYREFINTLVYIQTYRHLCTIQVLYFSVCIEPNAIHYGITKGRAHLTQSG